MRSWWLVVVLGLAVTGCDGGGGGIPSIFWGAIQPEQHVVQCTDGLAKLDVPGRTVVSLAGTVGLGTVATSATPSLGTTSGPVPVTFADGHVVAKCLVPDLGAAKSVTFLVPRALQ
jgi:prepilin-type processing-associated H-X9-DG protein